MKSSHSYKGADPVHHCRGKRGVQVRHSLACSGFSLLKHELCLLSIRNIPPFVSKFSVGSCLKLTVQINAFFFLISESHELYLAKLDPDRSGQALVFAIITDVSVFQYQVI